jgi:copper homeostasis protein (lipoprotein)
MKNFILITLILAIFSCAKKQYPSHNSMNSVDWNGVYEGRLPGGNAVLTLNPDLTYSLSQGGKTTNGDFVWAEDGGRILLAEDNIHLKVGENFVSMVTMKGKELGDYKLERKSVGDLSIREKYWKLVELNGKPVKGGQKEPHLILKGDRVTGNGGCNGFGGSYELDESTLRISFSQVAATQMACMDAEYESEFFRVLGMVDNYSTDGKTLSLNKARMAPLARFELSE